MALNLLYITNNLEIAKIAEDSGVDILFVDLEINGKVERQGKYDTVISRHSIEDIEKIKESLTKAKLLVRINPIFVGSKDEIESVIQKGADIVMLPYFKTKEEANAFISYVGGKAKTCLLCETAEAVEYMDDILDVEGIDSVYIGLNDLHLSYNMDFMFEPLADGTVERICNKCKLKGIPYGFGGISKPGNGDLPAEYIIGEHYRLGSSMVILSRSFFDATKIEDRKEAKERFTKGVKEIRELEDMLQDKDALFFEENRNFVYGKAMEIAANNRNKNLGITG